MDEATETKQVPKARLKSKDKKPKGQWGGYRPHNGNKGGRPRKPSLDERAYPADVVAQCTANPDMTPLDYMLSVMRNPDIDHLRRDRMAIAAAPYVHGKIMDKYVGKKEVKEEESRAASEDFTNSLALIAHRDHEQREQRRAA